MKRITLLFILSISLSLSATNTLVVKVNSGNTNLHGVGNIRNIIFQSGQMVVNTKTDNPVVYPLTDIQIRLFCLRQAQNTVHFRHKYI